ncbi:hypothetical protein R1sor_001145 [Riccia sorocarpa]|uniref:Uncharacterized protein n=1 Tax=Riccia sorocarpa TaxID=122646 RepID=A0ABD3GW14_9MARC
MSAVRVVCKTAIDSSVRQSAVNRCVPIERDEARRIVNSRIRDRMRPFVDVLILARDGPQAGARLHFELYTKEDEENYMRWKWISKKEAHRVLRGIDAALLQRSGLHDALWLDWSRPEEGTEFVKEFVLN